MTLSFGRAFSFCGVISLSNFPVMLKRDVILKLSFVGDVRRGIDAGKRAEIVNEMSLIEVAARQRDLRPIDHGACRQCAQVV